jgi:hypothetical protein
MLAIAVIGLEAPPSPHKTHDIRYSPTNYTFPSLAQPHSMSSPQHPKRKRTLSPNLPPAHCRAIVDDEEEEDESFLSRDERIEEEEEEHGLIGHHTILVSDLKPGEYTTALTRLQGAGLPIIANKAPYCTVTEVMGLNIPKEEINETAHKLTSCWRGPGHITIGIFKPAKEQVKVAIQVTNKGNFTIVTLEALTEFLGHKGIQLNLSHSSLSIIVPGTWLLLLNDTECTSQIYTLCCIILLGKELEVGPWKDSYHQAEHCIYMQGLANMASWQAILDFLWCRCGEIMDHHFGKLKEGHMAPWMMVQFKMATSVDHAIALSGTIPPFPPPLAHHPLTPPGAGEQARNCSMASQLPLSGPSPRLSARPTSVTRTPGSRRGRPMPPRPWLDSSTKQDASWRTPTQLWSTNTTPQKPLLALLGSSSLPSCAPPPGPPCGHTKPPGHSHLYLLNLLLPLLVLLLVAPTPASCASMCSNNEPASLPPYGPLPAPVLLIEYWVCSLPPPTRRCHKQLRPTVPRPATPCTAGLGGLLVIALVALLAGSVSMASAETTQLVEVDYTPGEIVTSIATACRLLNVVSININRVSEWLLAINHLMDKRNWHIVLVQETGVVSKANPNPHVTLHKSMHNNIYFNSLHQAHLQLKQYNAKIRELNVDLQAGTINQLQYNTQTQLANGR